MSPVISISESHPAPPCTVVIVGASGDLARRKLIPALYNLDHCGEGILLPETSIVGFARTRMSADEFRKYAREAVDQYSRLKAEEHCWRRFEQRLDYVGGLDQSDGFERMRERVEEIECMRGLPPNRVFYLSIPPGAITSTVSSIASAGMIADPRGKNFSRVVVEKPIGRDLPSAREISEALRYFLAESQIFRIDHYLGKETVQNLFVLRFGNAIFERLWGARNVDHVQITVAEAEGVGARAGYYDRSGALRDMVQNHMLQVMAMLAMEPPVSLDAGAIREARLNLLTALRPITVENAGAETVRARYTLGTVEGKPVHGYLQEEGVPPQSRTETYVALRAFIDNWRWASVPFYLRTGKRMPRRESFIAVVFKNAPQILFNRRGNLPPNVLTIRIQPDEGFSFDVMSKRPGTDLTISPVQMNLHYSGTFDKSSPDAYERLLLDVMAGDHTLFPSDAFVSSSWGFVQSILDAWSDGAHDRIAEYAAGTWGPREADALVESDGRRWINP